MATTDGDQVKSIQSEPRRLCILEARDLNSVIDRTASEVAGIADRLRIIRLDQFVELRHEVYSTLMGVLRRYNEKALSDREPQRSP